jgi:mRNA interferase RelE/StbE
LEALPDDVVQRLAPRIDALAEDPRPRGAKKLHGEKNLWRIRIGDYRVVYSIDSTGRVVDITRVAHRREVYE